MTESIASLLRNIGQTGSFATHRTAASGALKLVVDGVGPIRFPITQAQARELCLSARPARHGRKEKTLLDRRVRDTWEIPARRISIDERVWNKTLQAQLAHITRDLGLPENCRLSPTLHNLLVYGPGQFFVAHRDTEKTPRMVGTLVVGLPSRFSGGAMSIAHHDHTLRVRGSATRLGFTAFYADCEHEVSAVEQGYRVALTYNLHLEGDARSPGGTPAQLRSLAQAVRRYFDAPLPARWSGDRDTARPDRLVYLLDHQYTRRGLAWDRLKSADAARAAALREVAAALDCEIFLALADVHETWESEPELDDHPSRRGAWRASDDGDDEDEEFEDDAPDDDLPARRDSSDALDSEVDLRHWVDANGRPEAVAGGIDLRELCYTKPSSALAPFQSEHQGYMGNYGNTVEYWYYRAAVVLWPRERTFLIRAKASPLWAVAELTRTLASEGTDPAKERARQLLPFWTHVAGRDSTNRLLQRTLALAARLRDPELASGLLLPFSLSQLGATLTPQFVACLDRYGVRWCRALLGQWAARTGRAASDPLNWIEAQLPGLCGALHARASAAAIELAHWLLVEQWNRLHAELGEVIDRFPVKDRHGALARLRGPLLALIESAALLDRPAVRAEILQALTAGDAPESMASLGIDLLRAAREKHRGPALHRLELGALHAHALCARAALASAAPRRRDDWSIETPLRCKCPLCVALARYLRAPDQVRLEWPLAKAQRMHVHQVIDALDLPLRHTTRRSGRPFTLMLEKTSALFERSAAAVRAAQADLHWLRKTAGQFG